MIKPSTSSRFLDPLLPIWRLPQGSENGIADAGSRLSSESGFERAGFSPPQRRPVHEVNFTDFSYVLRNRIACSVNAPCELQVWGVRRCGGHRSS